MDPLKTSSKPPSPPPPNQPPRRRSRTSSSTPRTSTSDLKLTKSPTPSSGKDRLLSGVSKMTSWLSTSEPSAQALKQHKKDAFARAGIPLGKPDAQVHVKLHAPIGEIPQDAIRAAGGLTPEEVARRKAAERRQKLQDMPYAGGGSRGRGGGASSSSGLSSGDSTLGGSVGRGPPSACPWEELSLEEWDK